MSLKMAHLVTLPSSAFAKVALKLPKDRRVEKYESPKEVTAAVQGKGQKGQRQTGAEKA
ncbi:hypothetical protein [Pseudomonas reinekei]|uniref:hypothetical protein n=1 Tax=Pseudomonas reinekei TaxID=395598 RepID=UPI0013906426|nr:hypothetical protein [Pseudomonas reinekei]